MAGLSAVVENTGLRNLNWTLSYSKIFPLTSDDAMWQRSVTALLPRMDLIVVDLSEAKSNVAWELQECGSLGLEDRLLFLTNDEVDPARLVARYQDASGVRIDPRRICAYNTRGVVDTASLRRVLESSSPERRSGRDDHDSPASRLAVPAVACFSLGFYPLLPLAFYPETNEDSWTYNLTFWNPWEGNWPAVPEVVNTPALALFGFGVVTLLMLALAGRRTRSLRTLLPFQVGIVMLTAFGYVPSAFLYLVGKIDWSFW